MSGTRSRHRERTRSADRRSPARKGLTPQRRSVSARKMLPTPEMTDWSMSSSPIGRRRLRTPATKTSMSPSARSGSGPSRRRTAARPSASSSSQAAGPVRSATPCSPARRRRTAPRGSGGSHSPGAGARASSSPPDRPDSAEPPPWRSGCSPRSPTRRRGAPMACGAVNSASPSKVHAPYRPRWMRSQTTASSSSGRSAAGAKGRNRCLPCARASSSTWPFRRAAPAAKRPCGEETARRRPA